MDKASRPHDDAVVELLRNDPAFVVEYLQAARNQADEEGRREALLSAVRRVSEYLQAAIDQAGEEGGREALLSAVRHVAEAHAIIDFEKFAAFGDIGELERVCYLIELAAEENQEDIGGLIAEIERKIGIQDLLSFAILESERPGLYPKTWMAGLFTGLYVRLDELAENPRRLRDAMPGLLLDFHKVLIAAHNIYDPKHRATLVAKAMKDREIYQAALDLQAPHAERGKKYSADQSVKGQIGAEVRWSGEDREDLEKVLQRLARRRDALGDWEEPSELWPELVGKLPAASERNGSNLINASVIFGNDRAEFTYSAFRKRIARIRNKEI
jgi:hypothetical protein